MSQSALGREGPLNWGVSHSQLSLPTPKCFPSGWLVREGGEKRGGEPLQEQQGEPWVGTPSVLYTISILLFTFSVPHIAVHYAKSCLHLLPRS